MNMRGKIGGVGAINTSPLISFDIIIDKELSLISYLIKYIRNENVFDLDRISNYSMVDVIRELYTRRYTNPLYFLMKYEEDKEFLDECYKEFEETQEYLDYFQISTDFYNAVQNFINSGEVNSTILCRTEKERSIVKSDKILKNTKTILVSELNTKIFNSYGQLYLRYITDIDEFMRYKFVCMSCYFSTSAMNFTEDNNINITDNIKKIMGLQNQICIFDMYRQDILRRT